MDREIYDRISADTFGRAASQVDCCLLFLNIFSSSKVVTFKRRLVSQQKKVKSIKFVTSCDEHVSWMKNLVNKNQSIITC